MEYILNASLKNSKDFGKGTSKHSMNHLSVANWFRLFLNNIRLRPRVV